MGHRRPNVNEERLAHVRAIREQLDQDHDAHDLTVHDLLAEKDERIRELTAEVERLRAELATRPQPESAPIAPKPEFDFYRD